MSRRVERALLIGLLVACREDAPSVFDAPSHTHSRLEPDDGVPPGELEAAPEPERKQACVARLLADAEPRLHTTLRALCGEWVDRELPGVAFALVEPGREPIHVELGVRCSGEAAPVTADTPFRLGSISKPITAALALGLVAQGRLALDASAASVPGFETQARLEVPTLDLLLSHRSGLGEIEPAQLVELGGAWLPALTRSPAAGLPSSFHYSNTGYALIGAMIEANTQRRYEQVLRAQLARAHPSFTSDAAGVREAACGHLEHDLDRHPIPVAEDLDFMPGDPRWLSPAGGVLASASDLAGFALRLGEPSLPGSAAMLVPGEARPAHEGQALRRDERYGLGLRSWTLGDGTRAYGHSGNNVAFAAELMFVPGRRAIVVLSNCGAGLPATLAAAEQLL